MRQALTDTRAWPLLAALIIGAVLVYLLQPILTPFLVGALLAYLGDPIADRLQRLRLSRTVAVTVVFLVLTLLLLGIVVLLVPMLARQLGQLQSKLPLMLDWLQQQALPWLESTLGVDVGGLDVGNLRQALTEHWESTGNVAATVLKGATQSTLALIGVLVNVALIPVVTFYLLRDWDTLIERIRSLLPRRVEPVTSRLARECEEVVGAFLRGQLLVMLCLGAIYSLGLWLVGLNLGLLIGFLSGLASIVPYLGTILGVLAASIATVFQFEQWLIPLLLVWCVFGVGQLLEGTVLTPLLVGDRIGMHPVAVIFAVLAGGQLFGFVGVLLALPTAAVVVVLLRHARDRYVGSELYARGPDAPPPPE